MKIVFTSTDPKFTITKSHNSLWLEINRQAFFHNDVYLMISKCLTGYHVKGIHGFGGLGYSGYMSTQKLVKGLKKMGFELDAKTLRKAAVSCE